MSKRIRILQYTRRWLSVGSSLALGGCAMRGADRPAAIAPTELPALHDTSAPVPTYVVGTPSFALVASSEVAKGESVTALRSTADTFRWLFGERPVQIGVVVVDTTASRPETMAVPSARLTTITLAGGGLAGATQVRAAATLRRKLRFLAANAWLSEYAASWSVSLKEQGIMFHTADGLPVPPAQQLPDWLHVATLQLLAGGDTTSAPAPSVSSDELLPLRELFSTTLSPGIVAGFERWLCDADDAWADAGATEGWATQRQAALFGSQSASVLEFLRETHGDRVVAEILGASVGGLEMPEILASFDTPTSPEQLDVQWREWLRQRSCPRGMRCPHSS
jgi:hypothetical protein